MASWLSSKHAVPHAPRWVQARRLIPGRFGFVISMASFLLLIALAWPAFQLHARLQRPPTGGLACVAWRATAGCSGSNGNRALSGDLPCDAKIVARPGTSGFCECENRVVTRRTQCRWRAGPRSFTCANECKKLTRPFGLNPDMSDSIQRLSSTCAASDRSTAFDSAAFSEAVAPSVVDGERKPAMQTLWASIERALYRSGALVPPVPPLRDKTWDFVRQGFAMSSEDVEQAQAQMDSFVHLMPAYPEHTFEGEGVVTIAGGLQYMPSTYVMITMLRRAGCSLPAEVWFASDELPPAPLKRELSHDLRASIRSFGEVSSALDQPNFKGFKAKVAAVLFSRFQHVVWIDADNVPVTNVGELLQTREYADYGAIFWKDFWLHSGAPDLWRITRISESSRPSNAHESGQMAIDKQQGWRALLLALLFNVQEPLYKRLLSNYMGQGDKESFPIAWLTLGIPYYLVQHPPTRVGEWSNRIQGAFKTRTMGQKLPNGDLAFLHNNIYKFDLALPSDFAQYKRRWVDLAPMSTEEESFGFHELNERVGFDLELECFNTLAKLRCKPWFDWYATIRRRLFGDSGLIDLGRNYDWSVTWYKGINLQEHQGGEYRPWWRRA